MKIRFDRWFPEKDWNVHIWVHAYDVSLFTVYKYALTDNSYFTKMLWLIITLFQSHGGNCLTAWKSGVKKCIAGKCRLKKSRGKGIRQSGFASWLASPHLSSFLEWSAACLPPAPQARKQAPSPNLSWHWSRQTSLASCLLQSDKQDHHSIK